MSEALKPLKETLTSVGFTAFYAGSALLVDNAFDTSRSGEGALTAISYGIAAASLLVLAALHLGEKTAS